MDVPLLQKCILKSNQMPSYLTFLGTFSSIISWEGFCEVISDVGWKCLIYVNMQFIKTKISFALLLCLANNVILICISVW